MLRLRKLVVQPGGVVPWHEHAARPANILVAEGSITEYRSTCKVPIEHKAGDVTAEFGAACPLVEEQRQGAGHPLLRRHPAAGHGRAHDVSSGISPDILSIPPTFPAGQAGNVEPFRRTAMTSLEQTAPTHAPHGRRRQHAFRHHRADRLPDAGRPVRRAGDPAVAGRQVRGQPRDDGLCGQCQHVRHGHCRHRRGAVRPQHRSPQRHLDQPCRARHPDDAAFDDRRHHDLRPAARRAGAVHVDGVHADRCLSRRAFLAGPGDRRAGRLRDRQCRQQFLRPHHVGGGRRYVRPLDQLPDLRRAQHRRRGARLGDAQEDRAHDGDGRLDA